MKNNLTELVFILDCSGSMAGMERDTIGGFNSLVAKQKQQEGVCYVSTVLFNNSSRVLHDRVSLAAVPAMTERDYTVGGCTALLDAIGDAIHHISNIHRYARPEDVPEHTLFAITTDGMENASRRYTAEQVKEMIRRKQAEQGWEFLFLGANIDAVETAAHIGIAPGRASDYHNDMQGIYKLFSSVSDAVSQVRAAQPLDDQWSQAVQEDFQARKKDKR